VTKHTRPKQNSWIIIFWFYPIEQFWLNPKIWFNLKVLYTTSNLSSIIPIFKLTNILRNHLGNFISCFAGSCGISTSLKAKTFSNYNGLFKAWEDGFISVICESDPQIALDLIQKEINICFILITLLSCWSRILSTENGM